MVNSLKEFTLTSINDRLRELVQACFTGIWFNLKNIRCHSSDVPTLSSGALATGGLENG